MVYGLSLDGVTFRYIGKTNGRLRRRWSSHVWAAKQDTRTAVRCWIMKHGPENIVLSVLEQCSTPDELSEAEQRWIRALREQGVELLNHTDGGEGAPGWSPTAEQRAAMSAAGRGRTHSEDTKARMRAHAVIQRAMERAAGKPPPSLGVPKSPEHVEKMRNRVVGVDSRQRMSEAAKLRGANNKGIPMSEAQKAKLRVAHLGTKASSETRAKMSAAHRGRPKSPEHRARIAEAVRRARAAKSAARIES